MGTLKEIDCLNAHDDRVWCVKWNPMGTLLASCGGDKKIVIWAEDESGKWRAKLFLTEGHDRTIRSVAWSPDGIHLASCSFDKTICIWARRGGEFEAVASLEGHDNEVKSVAWSVSGEFLASCSRDKTVWVWSCEDSEYECISVSHSHTQDVKKVCWSPVEDVLASCGYDNTIKIFQYDGDEWNCTDTLTGHESTVWSISFDKTGQRLASCSDDNTVKIWQRFQKGDIDEKASWQCVCTLSGYHKRTIFDVDWNHLYDVIATASADDGIRIFREKKATQDSLREPEFELVVCEARAHSQDVNCVSWNPVRNNLLASCSDDGCIKVWSLKLDE